MTNQKPRPRVSIDAEAWEHINAILGDLPYRRVAHVVDMINQNGGLRGVPQPKRAKKPITE